MSACCSDTHADILSCVTARNKSPLLMPLCFACVHSSVGKLPLREPVRLSSNGTSSLKLSPIPPTARPTKRPFLWSFLAPLWNLSYDLLPSPFPPQRWVL